MVQRFYGVNFADDMAKSVTNGVADTGKDLQIVINIGANNASAQAAYIRQNKELVLCKLEALIDEIRNSKSLTGLLWPPAYT